MHPYRTHTCGELRPVHVGQRVRLSGWLHRKRDHGGVLFADLRDHYGLTQCVADASVAPDLLAALEDASPESVLTITGDVVERSVDNLNAAVPTGHIEVRVQEIAVLSRAELPPIQVAGKDDPGEDARLRHRYLYLRRERIHANMQLRAGVIASLRRRMIERGFVEYQTPILTASSPEGARDFLVPSRLHPGKFYALPQAPQQFKQLLMVAGFDRYFQIAPSFRDEDSRADRSPGEFYQLDFEMSFVTQEDVLRTIEPVLHGLFEEFAGGATVTSLPFPRIPYDEAMLKWGSDKPDLRNPLKIVDVTAVFRGSGFGLFAKLVETGACVRAVTAPTAASQPRGWFDKLNAWAREQGAGGLGYIQYLEGGIAKGPIAKNLDLDRLNTIRDACGLNDGDAVFFVCDKAASAAVFAGVVRERLCDLLQLREQQAFRFCWVVDFPMFEKDEDTGRIEFSHNPFSMPQGGLEALKTMDPLDVKAYQYDIVCNGVELSSGAIRNHLPEVMREAFAIAGHSAQAVEEKFPAMLNAFRFGAPPHGGAAPGIDRMVMLLAGEPNIREVIPFPMNGQAEDLMMGAPSVVDARQLRELGIGISAPVTSTTD